MSSITQCPQCNTRFKVSQEQLDAHHGMVRCGRCQGIFNATHYLYDDEPSPQLDLPILLAETQPNGHGKYAAPDSEIRHARFPLPSPLDETTSHSTKLPKTAAQSLVIPQAGEGDNDSLREFHVKSISAESTAPDEIAPAKPEEPSPDQIPLHEAIHVEDHTTLPNIIPDSAEKQEEAETGEEVATEIQTGNIEQLTLAQQITFAEKPLKAVSKPIGKPVKKKHRWPWMVGCLLLLAVLLAQAAYFFRIELSARLPGLKPVLISYCLLLQCTVPLPQKSDQLSIESSDLEVADPAQANVITLNAILRNHAPYAQAYPDFELTLTDAQDKAVARRAFHPAEYLRPDENEKQGLLPNRETSIKLHLDTTDLKPTGYRLFLFYPQ